MSDCHSIGQSGNGGIDCPIFNDRECPIHEEMIEILIDQGLKKDLIDYGLIEDDLPEDLFDHAMEILK